MRRLLYKYFSGDYLHVVHLMACHHRAKRIALYKTGKPE